MVCQRHRWGSWMQLLRRECSIRTQGWRCVGQLARMAFLLRCNDPQFLLICSWRDFGSLLIASSRRTAFPSGENGLN